LDRSLALGERVPEGRVRVFAFINFSRRGRTLSLALPPGGRERCFTVDMFR
jgi:hypothetical protein